MCKGGGMSQEQRDQIDSANNMENTDFTTPHGSQGVNNPNYADYVRQNPDLMANYNRHWIRGAPEPLSQKQRRYISCRVWCYALEWIRQK